MPSAVTVRSSAMPLSLPDGLPGALPKPSRARTGLGCPLYRARGIADHARDSDQVEVERRGDLGVVVAPMWVLRVARPAGIIRPPATQTLQVLLRDCDRCCSRYNSF